MLRRSQLTKLTRLLHSLRWKALAFLREVYQILARKRDDAPSFQDLADTSSQHKPCAPTAQAVAPLPALSNPLEEPALDPLAESMYEFPEEPVFDVLAKSEFEVPEEPVFDSLVESTHEIPNEPMYDLPDESEFEEPEEPALDLLRKSTYELPEEPALDLLRKSMYELPEEPVFDVLAEPEHEMPEEPVFDSLVESAHEVPNEPVHDLPDESEFKEPEEPAFEPLAESMYEFPEEPVFDVLAEPEHEMPEEPVFDSLVESTQEEPALDLLRESMYEFPEEPVFDVLTEPAHGVPEEPAQTGPAPVPIPLAESPLPDPNTALAALLATAPTHVTYRQLEEAMTDCGLVPQSEEETYLWLIEQLEAQDILVVDQIVEEQDTDSESEEKALAESAEMREILRTIFGNMEDEYQILTAEEQQRLLETVRLAKRAQTELTGASNERVKAAMQQQIAYGEQAMETLIVRNRRLVASLVLKHGWSARHLEFDDLFQEGMIGLHKAIERFDLDLHMQLSTYATWWIRQAIGRAIADQDRTIRLPVYRVESIAQYSRAHNELETELERPPTALEIAARLNRVSPNDLAALNHHTNGKSNMSGELSAVMYEATAYVKRLEELANLHPISLDQPATVDGDSLVGELIPDPCGNSTEEVVFAHLLQEKIAQMFEILSERERFVLTKRHGLDGEGEHTLEEVGAMYGVTRERIRQIQSKAQRKFRHPLRARKLLDFYEGKIREEEDEEENQKEDEKENENDEH